MPLCRGSHGHGDGLCSSAGTHTASRPAPAWDLLVHVSIMCALCAHVRDEEEEQTFCLAKSGLRRPRPLSSSHCPTCHAPPNHETPSGMRQRSNMLNAARESKVQDTGVFAAAAADRAPGACRTAMHSPAPSSHGAVTAQINKLRAGASGPPPRSWTGPPPGYRHPSQRAGATTGAGVEFWAQPESSAVASRLLVSVHSQHILTYVCVSLRDGHHVRAERDAEFIFRSCKLAHSRRRRQPLL